MTADTLTAGLRAACRRFPARPALVRRDRALTYEEFEEAASSLALAYSALGITRGDRIICQLSNRPEVLLTAAAAWQCGAVHVGADTDLALAELQWLVDRTEAAAVVLEPDIDRSFIAAIHRSHPRANLIVCGDAGTMGYRSHNELLQEGRDLAAKAAQIPVAPSRDEPAVIFFTSGTTASPKGVVHDHGHLAKIWSGIGGMLEVTPNDIHLGHVPQSHGFGFGLAVVALLTGGRVILLERFSPEEALRVISDEHVTVLHGSPAHFQLLTKHLDAEPRDVTSVRVGVGSAAYFPPQLVQRIFDSFPMRLVLSYGSSEGLGWATDSREEMLRGSVGRPPPDVARIISPDGRDLPAGRVGEIALRKVFPFRYFARPASHEPQQPPDDSWHRTGDLGKMDAEGHLYVLGRINHQLNRGGLTVDLGEVESLLLSCPGLDDAAIIAIPHAVFGQISCACIVPTSDKAPSLEEVRSYLAGSLAKHKLPEALCVLSEIPRTPRGKVDRFALVDRTLLIE